MEHLTLKAVTTAADQGTFEAVISSASIDREKDIVSPGGMVRALQKWVPTGKMVPLAWQHSTAADQQIGYIDPSTARVQGDEVVARGWIDQSTDTGAHAWRAVKAGTLGFSFGYLTTKATPRRGGGKNLEEFDVFEITATTVPMNNDTRVVGWKADTGEDGATVPNAQQSSGGGEARILASMVGQAQEFMSFADDDDTEAMREILNLLQNFGDDDDDADDADDNDDDDNPVEGEGSSKSARRLRRRAERIRLEHASQRSRREIEKSRREIGSVAEDDLADALIKSLIARDDLDGAIGGELKAVWTTAYVNTLPDSAFLYVAPGGTKDSDGKTVPRANRMFPYKDDSGAVDLPHLRNALARIPQSNLSQSIKDRLTATATRLLDNQKSADVTGKAPERARPVDPLRRKADAVALEYASDGESLHKQPPPAAPPAPPELMPLKDLRQRMKDETLIALTGGEH